MPNLTALASPRFALGRLFHRPDAIDALHRRLADVRRLDQRTLRDVGVTRADIDAELSRLPLLGL